MIDASAAACLAAAAAAFVVPLPAWPGRSVLPERNRSPRSAVFRRVAFTAIGAASALTLLGAPWWIVLCAMSGAGSLSYRTASRPRPMSVPEKRSLAATLDLLAACLDSGLSTASALMACTGSGQGVGRSGHLGRVERPSLRNQPSGETRPGRGMDALRQTAAFLALGGDPRDAWRLVVGLPELRDFASAAQRSALGGVRLAQAARQTAADLKGSCRSAVTDRAARAGVAMTAPLALCFLPAFLCLGLAPTVIGMVTSLHLW